jgi:gamma-glutamylaminecyclotransferase
MGMEKLVFVYGTLKRGGSNHLYLAGQTFVGEARTVPGFTLFELNGYPGMVPEAAASEGVTGEVWAVEANALARLDDLEGIAEGLYRREVVPLASPFDRKVVEGYVYARDAKGCRRLGATWNEKP